MKNSTQYQSVYSRRYLSSRTRASIKVFAGAIYTILLIFSCFPTNAQCPISYSLGCSSGVDIQNFNFTGELGTNLINLFSGCSPSSYINYAPMSVTLNRGGSYYFFVSSEATGGNIQIFIDYNDDGNFSAAESVGGGNGVEVFPSWSSFTANIPISATVGSHRLRAIMSTTSAYPFIAGCGAHTEGETHDYMCVISSTISPCGPPGVLMAGFIGYTSANVDWTPPIGAVRFQYVVDNTPSDPIGAGTSIDTNHLTVTGLTPGTLYYAHVRDSCFSGLFSPWVTESFTTVSSAPPCGAVSGIAVSAIASTSANISWPPVAGSSGYQYVVNTTMAPPYIYGTGITTFVNSVTPTGLIPETVYYVHVRDSCAPANMSVWVTRSFTTTPSCPEVTSLTASSITSTTAHVSWIGTAGSSGYRYVLDNLAGIPSNHGLYTAGTSLDLATLTAATLYYIHIRDSCGAGDVSRWATISFNTLAAGEAHLEKAKKNEGHVKLYPTPARDYITVEIADNQEYKPGTIEIYDIEGRLAMSAKCQTGIQTLNITNINKGIYIFKYSNNQSVYVLPVLKE